MWLVTGQVQRKKGHGLCSGNCNVIEFRLNDFKHHRYSQHFQEKLSPKGWSFLFVCFLLFFVLFFLKKVLGLYHIKIFHISPQLVSHYFVINITKIDFPATENINFMLLCNFFHLTITSLLPTFLLFSAEFALDQCIFLQEKRRDSGKTQNWPDPSCLKRTGNLPLKASVGQWLPRMQGYYNKAIVSYFKNLISKQKVVWVRSYANPRAEVQQINSPVK